MSPTPLEVPVPPAFRSHGLSPKAPLPRRHSPNTVLACAGGILAISLGVRHSFGLFLEPVSMAGGWGREVFGFAIALQNLIWGLSQPFAGMMADRIGAGWVIIGGAILYALGLVIMAQSHGEAGLILGTGVLIGLGLSGTTYPLVLGALSRATSPDKRSLAMGIAMGGAAAGQFLMLPGALNGIGLFGWQGALVVMALLVLVMVPLSGPLSQRQDTAAEPGLSAGAAVRIALGHSGFRMLALGFFVCGFQVVFIATHLPAFLSDKGMSPQVGSVVLALIGLVNIAGTYYAGLWGGRMRKPMLLTWVYLARAVTLAGFAWLPVSEGSAYLFGAVMGLFWLSTVPLTNGTIASVFGVRNMSMLGGVVFLAHQVGGFLGGWLGGVLFDRLGSYDLAWALAVGLSLLAALLNLPIKETALETVPA